MSGSARRGRRPASDSSSEEPRLIKKYSNRKLYDTRSRHYITLERIGELVRAGENVQVVDRTSGDDLTSVTLSQIVLETQRRHRGSVPEKVLQQLVRMPGGEAVREAVRQSVAAGQDLIKQAEERLVRTPESALEEALERTLHRLKIPTQKDFNRLERQLRELSGLVDHLSQGTVPAPRRTRPKAKA